MGGACVLDLNLEHREPTPAVVRTKTARLCRNYGPGIVDPRGPAGGLTRPVHQGKLAGRGGGRAADPRGQEMDRRSLRRTFVRGVLGARSRFLVWRWCIGRIRLWRTPWWALRLASALSLVAGCSASAPPATTAQVGQATIGTAAGVTGLGAEADAVWAELMAAWDEASTFRPHEVESNVLEAARRRVDRLLDRLANLEHVAANAPGLVILLRIEFQDRLALPPAGLPCTMPPPPRTPEAVAWERLSARVEALEKMAAKGYVNAWLAEHVLRRLAEDAAAVRAGFEAGERWRTEDHLMRQRDPAEALGVLERAEAALRVLAER